MLESKNLLDINHPEYFLLIWAIKTLWPEKGITILKLGLTNYDIINTFPLSNYNCEYGNVITWDFKSGILESDKLYGLINKVFIPL